MRKRLPFYCYFLPLLLGAGAWWFVSWLSLPRVAWSRTFTVNEFVSSQNPEPDSSSDDFPNIDGYLPDRELLFFLQEDRLRVQLNRIYGIQQFLSVQDGNIVSRGLVQTPCHEILTNDASLLVAPLVIGVKKHGAYTIECSISPPLFSSNGLLPGWCMEAHCHLRINDTTTGHSLLSLTQYQGTIGHVWTNQRFIAIIHDYTDGQWNCHVHAYELPFCTWSPWWGPGVGLFVALACCFMFKRRQPLQG
jgi:hypothetical protein